MTGTSLSRNISWTLAGNATYALSQWAVVVAVARVADTATVGHLAYAVALVAPPTALASLQLRLVMVTAAGRRFAFGDFLGLRIVMLALAYLGLATYCAIAEMSTEAWWTVVGVALWRGLDALAEIYYGRWQAREQMDRISKALVLNGVLTVSAVMCAVMVKPTAQAAAFASAFGSAITLAIVTSRAANPHGHPPTWTARNMWVLARAAAPLGIVITLVTLQGNVPRYVIAAQMGPSALGVFAAISQLPLAGGNIVAAIATATSTRLAQHHDDGDRRRYWGLLFRMVALGVALGVSGGVLAWLAGPEILQAVYGVQYAAHTALLVAMSLAAGVGFAASFFGYGMTMAGHSTSQTPLFSAVVLATFASCVVLVPRMGLPGAALGIAIGSMLQCLGSLLVLRGAMSARPKRVHDVVS